MDQKQLRKMMRKLTRVFSAKWDANRRLVLYNEPSDEEEEDEVLPEFTLFDKLDNLWLVGNYLQSALGDDFLAVLLSREGVDKIIIESLYKKLEGLIVGLVKSLTSKYAAEYLREQNIPGYIVEYVATYGIEGFSKKVRRVLTDKPTSHVVGHMQFPEHPDNPSRAISALSQLMRLMNKKNYPNLEKLVRFWAPYYPMMLLTETTWYVPLSNIEAWVKAGKPGDGSVYHYKVAYIDDLIKVANMDAEFLQDDLVSLLDIAYTKQVIKDYDAVGTLQESRLIRLITAIHDEDSKTIESINAEVYLNPNVNQIQEHNVPVEQQELEEESGIEVYSLVHFTKQS